MKSESIPNARMATTCTNSRSKMTSPNMSEQPSAQRIVFDVNNESPLSACANGLFNSTITMPQKRLTSKMSAFKDAKRLQI